MKSKFTRTIVGTILAIAATVGTTQTLVSGQQRESAVLDSSARYVRSIEGVWQTTVTQRNCQNGDVIRTAQGIAAYHHGGTMSETSNALPPALRGGGYGVWEKEGRSTYSASFVFQRYNPDGTFAGSQRTSSAITVIGNNTYETTTSIQIMDVNGNQVGSGCATATAVRFE